MISTSEIIQNLIEKDRLNCVLKDDMKLFLDKNFGVKVKSNAKKSEIKTELYKYLNEENFNTFTTLYNFGLFSSEVEELLNISKNTLNKLFDESNLRIIGTLVSTQHKNSVYKLYNINDVLKLMLDGNFKQKTISNPIDLTDPNLAESLYVINKSAKISRDTKNKAYIDCAYSVCKSAKTRMLNLYELKDKAMKKLIENNKMDFIGIHKQVLDERTNYLKLYRFCGFTYHIPIPYVSKQDEQYIISDALVEKITSEKSKKIKIKYQQAIDLLVRYVDNAAEN